jgi:hypothetical protein
MLGRVSFNRPALFLISNTEIDDEHLMRARHCATDGSTLCGVGAAEADNGNVLANWVSSKGCSKSPKIAHYIARILVLGRARRAATAALPSVILDPPFIDDDN